MRDEYIYEFEIFKIVYDNKNLEASLYENDNFIDSYNLNAAIENKNRFSLDEVLMFIAPTVSIEPYEIAEHFTSKDDALHWQQPCSTEMQAYNLHRELPKGVNINKEKKVIDTYIGLPWASFIDKKIFLGPIISDLSGKIQSYKKLAKQVGYTLNVHTVCQTVHWKRFLDFFYHLGVTDIHASHYSELLSKKENPYGLRIHSWHLFAVNVETLERNENIKINKPFDEKHLLASFKGAHMPHYISDVRLLLEPALKRDKHKEDIVVEVSDEWHFNKEVFSHQVKGIALNDHTTHEDVRVYNNLLSNSVFTLCPEGAGINTIRLWESLAVGSIPVVILSQPHIPMLFRLNKKLYKCAIVVFRDKVLDLFKILRNISKEDIMERQSLCRQIYLEIKNQTTFENQYNTLFGIY